MGAFCFGFARCIFRALAIGRPDFALMCFGMGGALAVVVVPLTAAVVWAFTEAVTQLTVSHTFAVERKTLAIERRIGPFRRSWALLAGGLHSVLARRSGGLHLAAHGSAPVELDLAVEAGTLESLAGSLRELFGVPAQPPREVAPPGWQIFELDGGRLLDPIIQPWASVRRVGARALDCADHALLAAPGRFELRDPAAPREPATWVAGKTFSFHVTFEQDAEGDERWGLAVESNGVCRELQSGHAEDVKQLGRHLAWLTGRPVSL